MPTSSTRRETLASQGWILAVIWLVFMVPSVISVWTAEHGPTVRVAATGALLTFAALYAIAFIDMSRWSEGLSPADIVGALPPRRWWYFAGLLITLGLAWLLAGMEVLGSLAFVVSFAAFHFTWPTVLAVLVGSVGVAVGVPFWQGEPELSLVFAGIVGGVGVATALIRLVEDHEQQRARLRTELAVTEEREGLARDVHDVVGHNLTATIVKVELAQRLLDGVEAATPEGQARLERGRTELADLEAVSRRSLAEIRATIGGTRTADLDDELDAARTVLADAGVGLTVLGDRSAIPDHRRATVAWAVREGVTNVVRHAQASQCEVALAPDSGVLLRVADDGVGLQGQEGNGLTGLRDRLAASGLALSLTSPRNGSSPSVGTELAVVEEGTP